MKKKIIVIGAGTIGLHCAFYLHQKGFEVELIEALPEDDESGCSYGNCGMLVPSHFIPLASPAMLRSGFKMLFDRKSPVYLPLAKNITHLPWFLKFMQAANKKEVEQAVPLLYRLNTESRRLYNELSVFSGNAMDYKHRGMLMVSTTEKGFNEEAEVAAWGNKLGIETEILDRKSLQNMEPNVSFNAHGAILYKSDAHIDPVAHLRWLKSYLKDAGVVFHYNTSLSGFGFSHGKVAQLKTTSKRFKADEYVLATGSFSQPLAEMAGIKLPLVSGKGYSIDFQKNEFQLRTPLILTEAKIAITPFSDRVRLGSGMEFNGTVGEPRMTRVQAILDRASAAIPSFSQKTASEQNIWEGLRPLTPSGVPFIGRSEQYNNLLIATGHAMMGVSLGPVTGKMISEMIEAKTWRY